MDLNKLSYLVALAECGSFTDAAEQLYTTQSSVTKKIQSLEEELGVKLVDRSKRKITITKAGEVVVQRAKELLASYNSMIREISGYVSGYTSEVKIAALPTMAHYNIPKYLADFQKLYPDITITVGEVDSKSAAGEFRIMNYDLGLIRSDHLDPQLYKKVLLFRDRLVTVLHKTHRLAEKDSIVIGVLEGEHFLQLEHTSGMYSVVVAACERAGFTPRIRYCGKHQENIVSMVENNMGISLMMQKSAEFLKTENVVIVPLKEEITSDLSLVRVQKRNLPSAAALFWDYMQKESTSQ